MKSPLPSMLLIRVCLLLFCLVLALQMDTGVYFPRDVILLSYGLYQVLVLGMYWFLIKTSAACTLLAASDMLITQMFVLLSGGLNSPFLICLCIPVFAVHYLYGTRGLIGGILGVMAGFSAMIPALKYTPAEILSVSDKFIINGIGLVIFYIISYRLLKRGVNIYDELQNSKRDNSELDQINHKLVALFEMTGRFRFDKGIAQIMDRLVTLCSNLFCAEGACIFLIRGGEVEIYGELPTAEEKEEIYQMIIEQRNQSIQEVRNNYVFRENTLVIPLIRGTRTDGVLYFSSWNQLEITKGDAVLFTMIANMICTYLENLDYVEALRNQSLSNTSVILNQLDSGKPVKGVLDRRIISQELYSHDYLTTT